MTAFRYTVEVTFGEDYAPRYFGVFTQYGRAQDAAEKLERFSGNYEVDGCFIAAQVIEIDRVPLRRDFIAFLTNEMQAERTDQ